MERASQIKKLSDKGKIWDMVVVGGGATGLGVAVDAATRGMSVACLEKTDFAKCTSSRSTKLVHGGVRYLQKGDVMLVLKALRERGRMKANAPHLVKDQARGTGIVCISRICDSDTYYKACRSMFF